VQLLVDYKGSVSQPGFPRTSLGVPREIMELINTNFEIPRKISNIPRNIAGISVQQLTILTTGNKLAVLELCSLLSTSSGLCMFSYVAVPQDMKKYFRGSSMGKRWETPIQSKKN
jgi:hypothetical protein